MLLMEGNLSSDTPPVVSDTVDHHLTRSYSDASPLTAENCKDYFLPSKNVTPDECTAWTNEKHYSYLYHLEMSFVEQLYQSTSVLTRCSGHNTRDINVSRKQLINLNNASNQYNVSHNGRRMIKCAAGEPIPSSTSADSHASIECKRIRHSKHRGVPCHPSPAKSRKLIGTWKQGKARCFLSFKNYNEGTGQNFSDELNSDSRAKKLKIALGDGSLDDQIVPSSR